MYLGRSRHGTVDFVRRFVVGEINDLACRHAVTAIVRDGVGSCHGRAVASNVQVVVGHVEDVASLAVALNGQTGGLEFCHRRIRSGVSSATTIYRKVGQGTGDDEGVVYNGQRAGYIGNVVVALLGCAGGRDGVSTNNLTSITGNGVCNHTFGIAILQTGNGGGPLRIGRAMHFLLVIGHHHSSSRVDGEGARGGCHLIVRVVAEGGDNGIQADIFASFTGKRVVEGIVANGTRYGGSESRICSAVVFVLVGSHHHGGFLVDGESARCGGHLVVRIAARRHGDGICADILTCGAGQGVIDNIVS